jgi:hypothetical protein
MNKKKTTSEQLRTKEQSLKKQYAAVMSPMLRLRFYALTKQQLRAKVDQQDFWGEEVGKFIDQVLEACEHLPERPKRGTIQSYESMKQHYETFLPFWRSWKACEKLMFKLLLVEELETKVVLSSTEMSRKVRELLAEDRKSTGYRKLSAWKQWLKDRDSNGATKPRARDQRRHQEPNPHALQQEGTVTLQ